MPASMISAPSGGAPYVIGRSTAIVAIGPMPGSTPIAVPSMTPMKQKPRLTGVTAAPNPVARWPKISISADPNRDRLAEQIDEQNDRERAHGECERDEFEPTQSLRRYAGNHRNGDHRCG